MSHQAKTGPGPHAGARHLAINSLDLWQDSVRRVPNAFLRGTLFGVSQRREMARKRELLAAVDGIDIWFCGEKFKQTDLDVWQMLLHMGRLTPLANRVEFSAQSTW